MSSDYHQNFDSKSFNIYQFCTIVIFNSITIIPPPFTHLTQLITNFIDFYDH